MIALHCTGSSGRQWRALAARLAASGIPLEAPDLFGSGATPAWQEIGPFSLEREAARIVAMIDEDRRPVHLVGHSYGGAVALRVALERLPRVGSLTLFEPSAFFLLPQIGARGRGAAIEIESLARAVEHAHRSGSPEPGARQFVCYWGGPDAWAKLRPEARAAMAAGLGTVHRHFEALIGEPTAASALAALRAPALVLHGCESPAPARILAAALGEILPGAETRVMHGMGHMGPLTHADDVAAIIAGFVARPLHAAPLDVAAPAA